MKHQAEVAIRAVGIIRAIRTGARIRTRLSIRVAIRSVAIVTDLVVRRTLNPALRIATAIVTVRVLLADIWVVVTIATSPGASLRVRVAIRSVAIVTDLVVRRTLNPALRIATALVAVRVLLTGIGVVVAIASTGPGTRLSIGVAIRSMAIIANLMVRGTLDPTLRITTAVVAIRV
jgi:hypothetical protein